jgi:hypothetical protein
MYEQREEEIRKALWNETTRELAFADSKILLSNRVVIKASL